MSLVYKSSVRENITDLQTYIVDSTPTSTKYFRVSDVPQVLQKGKNLLRITAHPTNLVPGSQVYVDVRDSNGNPIYYEIPDYLEEDKSRVISIWIYHDKGDDNTPNGQATITLAGTANVDENGLPLPERHRGKINVKWQAVVTVDRDRNNTSEIIFKSDTLPNVIVSQSVESYQNQPQSDSELLQTISTGKASYIKSGFSPIVQLTDGSTFNSEMVGGSIILNNFTEPATPQTTIENPLSSTFYSASITGLLNSTAAQVTPAYTTSFENRPDVIHTYQNIGEADYKITYIQSGSNVTTENFRNFVTLTFSNVEPITGLVDKIKVLQKSEGLPGEYELLNEVAVPFSSSFEIKVPIPSKNLNDPKVLKLQYLNSVGSISRTQTITNPFVFEGDNVYIGGNQNMISGSIFISNTLGTGIEIGGASSGFIRSVGYDGQSRAALGTSPGGFVIYSGSGNLVFGDDTLDGVGMQFVGDNDDRHLIFTTANGGLLDVKTDKFFIGTDNTQFISGSDGNIEISSSLFHLDPANDLLVIGADAVINADLSANNIRTPAQIGGVQSTDANASSSIKEDGFARFVSASVGGWDITTASIEGSNLIMKPEGILQTKDYIKDLKGWIISSEDNGFAEFENIKIRGTLSTTTFEKESVNAVGGQLYVANSTTISGSYEEIPTYSPATGVTSSVNVNDEQLADNLTDAYLLYDSTQYNITSVDGDFNFTLDTAIQAQNESANLINSQSLSGTATIRTLESEFVDVDLPHSASFNNKSSLSKFTTKFTLSNFTPITAKTTVANFVDAGSSFPLTISASGLTDGGTPVSNVFGGSPTGLAYFSTETSVVINSIHALNTPVDSGGEFFVYFDETVSVEQFQPSEFIDVTSGFVTKTDAFTDGEITFNDGGGVHTYPIKERISPTSYKVVTSSFKPNTSGSAVVASSAYSQSVDTSLTINAFNTTLKPTYYLNVSPSASGLMVDNVSGFANDEILTLKKVTNTGFSTEYVKIWSSSRFDGSSDTDLSGVIYVTRSYGDGITGDSASLGDGPSSAQSYEAGQVVVSTGKVGSGYIRINANPNDTSTPYIDIVERTGSGLYDVELKARLGDLSGLSSTPLVLGKSNPGFGLATDNVYLQGGITATFGEIGGFGINETTISSSNNNLILSSSGEITGSSVLFDGGKIGGFELGANIISSSNGNLILESNGTLTGTDANLTGDINADTGNFRDVNILGEVPEVTYDGSSIYLLETWSTEVWSGAAQVASTTIATNNEFGLLGWTASFAGSPTQGNIVGKTAYNTLYAYSTAYDSTTLTAPTTFQKWSVLSGDSSQYNDSIENSFEKFTLPFPSGMGADTPDDYYQIVSDEISLPDSLISDSGLEGLALQTVVRFAGNFGGLAPTVEISVINTAQTTTYKTMVVEGRNALTWHPISFPISDALVDPKNNTIDYIQDFRIRFRWYRGSVNANGAASAPGMAGIHFGELRLLKFPQTQGLFAKSLQFTQASITDGKDSIIVEGDVLPGKDATFYIGNDPRYKFGSEARYRAVNAGVPQYYLFGQNSQLSIEFQQSLKTINGSSGGYTAPTDGYITHLTLKCDVINTDSDEVVAIYPQVDGTTEDDYRLTVSSATAGEKTATIEYDVPLEFSAGDILDIVGHMSSSVAGTRLSDADNVSAVMRVIEVL